jgi:hypothetical protein
LQLNKLNSNLRRFFSHPLASTNVDLRGERLTKRFLEKFCASMEGRKSPLNSEHDLSRPSAGYVENYRVVPDDANPDEWKLIGDVYVDDEVTPSQLGGFSISGAEMLIEPTDADAKILLAYPYYNDLEAIEKLSADSRLALGKWVKKSATGPEWTAIIITLAVFVFQPAWEDVYKRLIAPRLNALISKLFRALNQEVGAVQFLQSIIFKGQEIQVIFIPAVQSGRECTRTETIIEGLRLVEESLLENSSNFPVRIVVYFDDKIGKYLLHRAEFYDGKVIHYVP